MKKFLSLLLIAFSVAAMAQKKVQVVYDFASPTTLNPSVTPNSTHMGTTSVDNKVFKNGSTQVSFIKGIAPVGNYIYTLLEGSTPSYSLAITYTNSIVFSTINGASIDAIHFSDDSDMGSLALKKGQLGTQSWDNPYLWTNNTGGNVESVEFYNNNYTAYIKKVTLDCTVPIDILSPISASLTNGTLLPSFDSMTLTFEDNMSVASGAKAVLSKADGTGAQNLTLSADGKVVKLSLASPLTVAGNYKIVVPAHSVKNADGFDNKELTYTFSVSPFFNVSADPSFGTVTSVPASFKVMFNDVVGKVDGTPIAVKRDGSAFSTVKMHHEADGSKAVVFDFVNVDPAELAKAGTYTIVVASGLIHNQYYEIPAMDAVNPEFTITYVVGDTPTPPTPPVPGGEDSETMKKAKSLLQVSGIGYPADNSTARTALNDLVSAATAPTDAELQTAIDKFYAESAITLPTSGKYYRIEGWSANGHKLYLAYKNNAVMVSDKLADASVFKATANANGTMSFQTTDNKYLHVLTMLNNYVETSSANVTASYNAEVNDLQVLKLNAIGVDADKQFGYMSIYGCLGKEKALGTKDYTFVMLDHTNASIPTAKYSDPAFSDAMSSAFKMVEVNQPDETLAPEAVAYSITPESIGAGNSTFTLTFNDAAKTVTLKEGGKANIMLRETIVATGTIAAVSGSKNVFTITCENLDNGSYTLTIPEGVFTFKKGESNIRVKKIEKTFKVERFRETIDEMSASSPTTIDRPLFDFELNELTVSILRDQNIDGLKADPSKVVNIVRDFDSKVVATGHFENMPDGQYVSSVKFVIDKPIEKGSLSQGAYGYLLEAGTFGDLNFGKYIAGDASVTPSHCQVNTRTYIWRNVNNVAAVWPTETAYTVKPDVAESDADTLKITFTDLKELQLAKKFEAYFANAEGKRVADATITAMKGKQNVFIVPLKGLDKASYTLNISEGAFLFAKGQVDMKSVAISAAFSIGKNGSADDERISFTEKNFTVAPASSATDFIKDVELNSITLTAAEGTKLAVNKARNATLYSPKNEVVATGVFANVDKAAGSAIRFVMDKQIEAGKLAAGTYSLKIQKGTFGNENFLKFLADKTTVKAEDCVANPDTTLVFYVDNLKAIKTTETKFELLPVVAGQKDNTLTLSFPEVETLSLVADAKAQFTAADGTKAGDAKLVADAEKKNVFSVSIEGLADGAYTLAISEGAFHYTLNDREVKTQAINAKFSVDKAVKVTETKFELLPAVAGQKDNTLTLSFPEVETLSLVADAKAQFTAADGTKAGDAKLVADAEKKNVFSVSIEGLADGAYTLAISEGAFHYTLNDREVKTQAINAKFSVDKAVKVTETKYELLPAVAGQKDNTLTLSFPEVETLTLVADAKAQFTAADGSKAADAKLVADAEKKNVFSVSIEGLADGAYTLAITEGAFHYTLNDREVKTQAINAQFTVDKAVKTVETKYELTPEVAESTDDHLTLTFPEVDALIVADGVTAQFNDAEGNKVADATFAADGEKKNQFTIALSQLDTEDYTLVIPEGAFIYTKDEIKVKTQAISYSFTIGKNGSADDERISFNYAGYTVKPESSTKEYLHDEELNNITVVAANDMTIAANTEREATLVSVVDQTNVVAKGHFEAVETAEGENATLRLVLDTPIVKGSLDAGVYMLQIAQGTFGNEEFGKFLADKKSVKAEDCVANAKTSILFYVDNTWTSINGIHADGTADGDIYTLQGVKVQKMTTPGVYIVNGKKIVKK